MKKAPTTLSLILCFVGVLSFVCPALVIAQEDDVTIPPDAHEKAIQALDRLGPDRGALTVTHREVRILGVTKAIATTSSGIEATMQDLSVKETETEIQIELSGDVLFDFDKWNIRDEAVPILHNVALVIKAYDSLVVTISGHTDSKGSETYNQTLSQKRAESVAVWLLKNENISNEIIETVGYGETRPAVANVHPDGSDCPECRRKNRRVEILVKKP